MDSYLCQKIETLDINNFSCFGMTSLHSALPIEVEPMIVHQDEWDGAHEGGPQHVGISLGPGLDLGALVGEGQRGGVTDPDAVQQARSLGKQLQHVSQGQVADVPEIHVTRF